MSKIRILIADDNLLSAQALKDSLSKYNDFEVVNIAKDGVETIQIIENDKPDVVLLDIIMPKLDGIGVLEHFSNVRRQDLPVFIIFSAIRQDNYITKVMNLGANYYIIKPFDEATIAERIRQLYSDFNREQFTKIQYSFEKKSTANIKSNNDDELRLLATKYMREFGLKAHMTGYNYIRDIIIFSFDSYCKTGVLPKGIYSIIAHKYGVSLQKVERAIRNCIEKGIQEDETIKKPTNSQLISEIIEKIRNND